VLHLHSSVGLSFFEKGVLLRWGQLLGFRVILHIHVGRFPVFARRPLLRPLVRHFLREADCVVALSPTLLRTLEEIAPGTRFQLIENGVAVPAVQPIPSESMDVVMIASLTDRKGVPEAIAAFARIAALHPAATLRLAGPVEPADRARYEQQGVSLGISGRIRFEGPVTGVDKNALLTGCSIFILPSHTEGVPLAMLEAMAAARPVVVTAVGGIPDVLSDGIDGFMVQPRDVHALADRLHVLLSNADLREGIGSAARATVLARFDVARTANLLGRLYSQLGAEPAMISSNLPLAPSSPCGSP
jgi:glycosyltransferase involved in cell wall biosynthesis